VSDTRPLRLLMFGRQGAGKGTQAALLAEHYGIPHVSTGDMLRAAAEGGTAFGRKAAEIMARGDLVPDDVMLGIIDDRLGEADAEAGVLLDGFPRTEDQAEGLDELLGDDGLTAVVNLEVPEEIAFERMLSRGRADDTPDAIRRRLELYEAQTAPLLAFYDRRDLVLRVDGVGDVEEIAERLVAAIDARTELTH
jgi:adenylate kinase